jgi:hypothetical protein
MAENKIARDLRAVEKKYENRGALTGEVVIYTMARDAAGEIERQTDEIASLRAELDAFKADVEAGRLVRYPEFPQDMNDLLEPLKVQSALNSEVMKLNFRKEHRPKDVSILDYTVIAALNKVLDEAARAALEGGQQ